MKPATGELYLSYLVKGLGRQVIVPSFCLVLVAGQGSHLAVGSPVVQGQGGQVVEGLL